MAKILVIEDSESDQSMLKAILTGHELSFYVDAQDIVARAHKHHPDLILLDIMLPGMDGFKACTLLQSDQTTSEIPVIFVTAKAAVEDKILGLNIGADDYIVKPFQARELRARVDAKVRKVKEQRRFGVFLVKGPFKLNAETQSASIAVNGHDQALDLTTMEFKLLLFLMQNEGNLIARDKIMESVWGQKFASPSRTVDSHMSGLRKKCRPYGDCFESVYGMGYRFSLEAAKKRAA